MNGISSRRVLWLVLAVGAVATAISLPDAPAASGDPAGPPVGAILVYEDDPAQRGPDGKPVNMEALIEALNRRINTGWLKKARIRQLGDRQIEIAVFGYNADTARRVEDLIERSGTLEFRILANNRDHKAIIDRARGENTEVLKDKDEKGSDTVLAWWVPVKGGLRKEDQKRKEGILAYAEIAKRTIKQGGKEVAQVLVVKDSHDVTGAFLKSVTAGSDRYGEPCVNFAFNAEGAERFRGLTGANLPEQGGRFTRELGIILDGELFSAPSIQSTISDRGEITGEFTKQEVEDLVSVLNAGALPAKVVPVRKVIMEPPDKKP